MNLIQEGMSSRASQSSRSVIQVESHTTFVVTLLVTILQQW